MHSLEGSCESQGYTKDCQVLTKIMARLVLELYSSIMMQCAWRRFTAIRVLKFIKLSDSSRNGSHNYSYRARREAAKKLVKWFKYRRNSHIATVIEKIVKARNRIFKWYRRRKFSIALRQRISFAFRSRIVNRAMIFGETRAANKIRKARLDASERSPARISACRTLVRFFRRIC